MNKPTEKKIVESAVSRVEKFKTQREIVERLAVLQQLKDGIKKGKRGIGAITKEEKLLAEKLRVMQNHGLDFGFYQADQFSLPLLNE